jgi:uncharacterized protein (TIGR02453 family)
MLQASTLQFVKSLKKNNNKEWFDKNRPKYETAKLDFAAFVQGLIDTHAKNDASIAALKAKDCMFRINRDVRFSKDKSPYKTNFGASINKAGKKSMLAGYYFHFEPGASFVGGGMYMPMPDDLKKVRQEIDYNFDEFKKIIGSKKFKTLYKDLDKSEEYSLARIPKGYEANNPAADYLKLKSFIAFVPISDADLVSKNLTKKSAEAFAALQPLIEFLNVAVEG